MADITVAARRRVQGQKIYEQVGRLGWDLIVSESWDKIVVVIAICSVQQGNSHYRRVCPLGVDICKLRCPCFAHLG